MTAQRTWRWLALGAAALNACSAGSDAPAAMPDVRAGDLAALQQEIAARRGKPLLVNFWAMWCVPCVAELPDLADVAKEFRAQGGEVLGVSLELMAPGTELAKVLGDTGPFLAKRGIDYPIFVYSDPDPSALNDELDLPGAIPVTIAFDARGEKVASHLGQASREELAELAQKARGQ